MRIQVSGFVLSGRRSFWGSGFKGLGFRVSGFKGLGFRVSGFKGLGFGFDFWIFVFRLSGFRINNITAEAQVSMFKQSVSAVRVPPLRCLLTCSKSWEKTQAFLKIYRRKS